MSTYNDPAGPRIPGRETRDADGFVHDVNPVCGHHIRDKCMGCGVCCTCDGCYCDEW